MAGGEGKGEKGREPGRAEDRSGWCRLAETVGVGWQRKCRSLVLSTEYIVHDIQYLVQNT